MEYAYALCFWFVLACGMIAISCGVFAFCAYVVRKSIGGVPHQTVWVTSSAAETKANVVEPSKPWPRTSPPHRLDEAKSQTPVTCRCGQKITTAPVRTQITDVGPHLVFNCPTCGEVLVPLKKT